MSRKNLEGAASTQSPITGGSLRPLPDSPTKPRLLDLFCCQGGASMGYHRAGFDVVGVDSTPQPHYPFEFIKGDALLILHEVLRGSLAGTFDAIHASPPCQAFTKARKLQGNKHPELVAATRDLLEAIGLPYVIENVPGAPLNSPVELCGAMFPPLKVYRHRLFETNFPLPQPPHVPHIAQQVKMGRPPGEDQWHQPVGNFSGVPEAQVAMGMPWANQQGLREAVPPAYTEWIGRFLMAEVREPQRSLGLAA